jgi:purine-binding chemotaxis protein CheW
MLCDERYAFDIRRVQEIVPQLSITPVPTAHDCVEGLANLRGTIVPILSLRHRLGLAVREPSAPYVVIILRIESQFVGVIVDEPRETQDFDPAAFGPPPETLADSARLLIGGVFQTQQGLLPVLDVDNVIDFEGTSAPIH